MYKLLTEREAVPNGKRSERLRTKVIIQPNKERELRNLNEGAKFPGPGGVRGEKTGENTGEGSKKDALSIPQPIIINKSKK